MRKIILAALGAGTMLFAFPAAAQDIPLVNGNYWNVTEISIDDGHFSNYADYLASEWRKQQDFAKFRNPDDTMKQAQQACVDLRPEGFGDGNR